MENKPISMDDLKNVIERVQDKYPLIDKITTTIIIKTVFEVAREELIKGNTMHVHKFMNFARFVAQTRIRKNKKMSLVRSKISTPRDKK